MWLFLFSKMHLRLQFFLCHNKNGGSVHIIFPQFDLFETFLPPSVFRLFKRSALLLFARAPFAHTLSHPPPRPAPFMSVGVTLLRRRITCRDEVSLGASSINSPSPCLSPINALRLMAELTTLSLNIKFNRLLTFVRYLRSSKTGHIISSK